MFPDGTGGLASWARAGVIEQAKLIDAAVVRKAWNMGDFMV